MQVNRRNFVRSSVAGSMLMSGVLHELLAADENRSAPGSGAGKSLR